MTHYKLLTPGPLTTSDTVKQAMLKDWCTWDDDYNLTIVQSIRQQLVSLATQHAGYSSVLMQGSGTASVESVLGSAISNSDKVLVIDNGAYGRRMVEICQVLGLNHMVLCFSETQPPCTERIAQTLQNEPEITHLAMVHCETTTGMLNPLVQVAQVCQQHEITFILDAMSSFGGIPFDIGELDVGFMISSANKCIQGVPGFGFVVAKKGLLAKCQRQARSLSLDLHAQWKTMEECGGKWRFTSPTHVVRAFYQALDELEKEGGIEARHQRYSQSQALLVEGMQSLGLKPLLDKTLHSPIITSFLSPLEPEYNFNQFYQALKQKGFVIYPGKVSHADCFRIGHIGEINSGDIAELLSAIKQVRFW